MYSVGIDSGSRTTKICVFDLSKNEIFYTQKQETTSNHEEQLGKILSEALSEKKIQIDDVKSIICTGYGRKKFSKATGYSSEIICHSKGVNFLNPDIRTVIDIGGQDAKIIKVSAKGKVLDFVMNDKCAAGTGRFLEKVAQFFDIDVSEIGNIAGLSTKAISISSTCVVFAESEMIGLIANGENREDIINAIHNSIIHRVLAMGISIEFPVAFVGGVARNSGMVTALETYLGQTVFVPVMPDMTGAIGAALSVKFS